MSKPVRISDYLAKELGEIAKRENRSLANLVQHLLTQALQINEQPTQANAIARVTTTISPPEADRHFKPDFK